MAVSVLFDNQVGFARSFVGGGHFTRIEVFFNQAGWAVWPLLPPHGDDSLWGFDPHHLFTDTRVLRGGRYFI